MDNVVDDVLTREQLGHLRHVDNLSRRLPNDWSLMQGRGQGQDDFGGYRFQLAYMAYALALTHRHRLPNAPGAFQGTFRRLIDKILNPEVWLYWRDLSRGGSVFNAHLSDRLHEEFDPVAKDNIMYSAYVQSMTLMYDYLFADHRYAQPGAVTFEHFSFFWGGAPKRFEYDQNSLNEVIYWQMVESGFLGVACEPNCVFQICNQPAILGFRMHDLLHGTDVASEVTRSYAAAWADLRPSGHLDGNGHFNAMMFEDTKVVRPNDALSPWVDSWCGSLMNMWNRDFVHEAYASQIGDLVRTDADGLRSVPPQPPREVMGKTLTYDWANHGWTTVWASEMGDSATLAGLLGHADRHMSPTWRDDGLYYPRNDAETDSDGHSTLVSPVDGNALLGYARLNVPDGLWRFYNEPWDSAHYREPMLRSVAADVEVSQARFDPETRALTFRLRRTGSSDDGCVVIDNIGTQRSLTCDGAPLDEDDPALQMSAAGALQLPSPPRWLLARWADRMWSRQCSCVPPAESETGDRRGRMVVGRVVVGRQGRRSGQGRGPHARGRAHVKFLAGSGSVARPSRISPTAVCMPSSSMVRWLRITWMSRTKCWVMSLDRYITEPEPATPSSIDSQARRQIRRQSSLISARRSSGISSLVPSLNSTVCSIAESSSACAARKADTDRA